MIMLIEGWGLSPGEAALVVTAMPLAALVAGRWARARHRLAPALPGSVLLAGGLAALGLLPGAARSGRSRRSSRSARGSGCRSARSSASWPTPTARARSAARPSWTIAARHAGIVLGLLILTPIFTADLNGAQRPAELAGVAHLLDAPISLKPKIALARSLSAEVQDTADQELPDLDAGFAAVDVPAGRSRRGRGAARRPRGRDRPRRDVGLQPLVPRRRAARAARGGRRRGRGPPRAAGRPSPRATTATGWRRRRR